MSVLRLAGSRTMAHLRLALEIFHDVEKPIIDVWLLMELDLHLVQVAQSVLHRARG